VTFSQEVKMQISFLAVCMLAAFGFAQAFVPATNFNGVARAQVASSKAPMQMMAKIASKVKAKYRNTLN